MSKANITEISRKLIPVSYCGAVIVAAGSSSRMGATDKIMAELGGEPLISRTVRAFQNSAVIREIVVVTREDLIIPVMSLCHGMEKVKAVVAGGKTRQESVQLGINALSGKVKLVAVHDGARPFASDALIDRVVRAGHSFGAAIPAVPVKDTVKETAKGVVTRTPDRAGMVAAQTPQVFDYDLLRGALRKGGSDTLTDDASAVEAMGMTVKVVEGDEKNIKITTPFDMKIANLILEEIK